MSEIVHFSARQLKFIDWLAETKFDRVPSTQALLAANLGINPRTLTRWKQIPELMEAVEDRTREKLREDFPEILGALRREAIKGNFQHIKMALEMLGEYVPTERRELTGPKGATLTVKHDLADITDDELNTLAEIAGRLGNHPDGAGKA